MPSKSSSGSAWWHERAAVDGQLDAGDVLRLVRREVHDAGGDVGRFAEARHHDVLLERGLVLRVVEDRRSSLRYPVKMKPTMIALVRMSSLPKSTAICRVSALMAPLDAWYAGRWGSADFDELAEMFTIEPLPALRISGIAYFVRPHRAHQRDAQDLIEGVVVDLVDVAVVAAPDVVGAIALFTSVVSDPNRSTVAATAPATCSSTPLSARTYIALTAGVVDPGLDRAAGVLRSAGERHRGALGRQHLDDALADAPGAAGDQRHLPVEPHRSSSLALVQRYRIRFIVEQETKAVELRRSRTATGDEGGP